MSQPPPYSSYDTQEYPAQQYPPQNTGHVYHQPPPPAPHPGYPHQGYPQQGQYPDQGHPMVIQTQPQMGMPGSPPGASDVLPGLQYLAQLNQVLVKQKVEIFEAFTGFETSNKYKVLNAMGQPVFSAQEDTD
eukprot:TCALIF_01576-PA protein Name:"Similar to Plscr2 Phospholipid scramblase 2 (Mus musculus)" AED:0.54 eAED:0.54 QI:0/0/0/0.5/1/1/2/0/131